MSRVIALACVVWVASIGGCRAALAFPDPRPEGADLESCRDGLDEDLDGAVDCADPDCDGSCTEEAPRCADGRDNDLDGAFDRLDPSCWGERALGIERCATIEGTDTVLESGAEFGWTGTADRIELDGRSYFGATTRAARIAWAVPLAGGVDGTDLRFSMRHDGTGRGAITLVPLSSVSDDLVIAPQAVTFRIELEEGTIRVRSGNMVQLFTRGPIAEYDRYEVHVSFGASSTFEIQPFGGPTTSIPFVTPSAWAEDEPLVLLFEADVAPTPISIGDVTVHRPSIEHCGRRVPEIDALGENELLDVSRGPEGVCVLASVDPEDTLPRRVRSYASTDGVTFTEAGSVTVEGVPLGASIAWDARASAWVGVVAGEDAVSLRAPTPEWARALGGPDCAHLAIGASLGLPLTGLDAPGVDYAVLEDGTHRITFDYLAQTSDRYGLRAFLSPDGRPDGFEVTTIDVGDAYDALRQRGGLPSIDTLLVQRLVWLELGGQIHLFREIDGGWVEAPGPVLEASNTPGSFDRGRVLGPRALMEPPPADGATPWRGRLYFSGTSGAGCPTCGRIGSADLTVSP